MLEITNLVTPSPEDFEVTIKGMRLPMKSVDRSDSFIDELEPNMFENCYNCDLANEEPKFILGEKDKQLLLNLCKAGDPSHRKVLRQLPVKCFITAPLYWWKQADKYQIGTVTNAESTMHCLIKKEFELSDFSTDYLDDVYSQITFSNQTTCGLFGKEYLEKCIQYLNDLRFSYLDLKYSLELLKKDDRSLAMAFTWHYFEINDEDYTTEKLIELVKKEKKKYWYAINELLPQSYNQTRCWSGNYEVLVNIINQRSGHKLGEWKSFIDYMLENVPYLKEIVEAINETND